MNKTVQWLTPRETESRARNKDLGRMSHSYGEVIQGVWEGLKEGFRGSPEATAGHWESQEQGTAQTEAENLY